MAQAPTVKSPFDLRREQAQAQSEEAAQREKEAIQRRLAAQGQGKGSGILEKEQRIADVERRKALASRLGAIDVAQGETRAAEQEAQRQRMFQAGEAAKQRAFGLGSQRLGIEAAKEAQQAGFGEAARARAFGAGETAQQRAFQLGMAKLGQEFTANQADLDRELQREVEEGRLGQNEAQLAEQARQFDSQQDFAAAMAQQGFQQDAINRAWQADQNAQQRAFSLGMERQGQQFQTQMAGLQNEFAIGRMNVANNIEQQNQLLAQQARSAYSIGASGASGGALPEHFKGNALLTAAFKDGRAGRDIAEAERDWTAQTQARNALILSLDPRSSNFATGLENIFAGTGGEGVQFPDVPEGQTVTGTSPLLDAVQRMLGL